MALDTATAKADPPLPPGEVEPRRRLKRFSGSRLGGLILALNLLSLLILFVGALLLNEWQRGLIEARQQTLKAQGELLVTVLGNEEITRGDPQPALDPFKAGELLIDNFIPEGQRARLFDIDGLLVADSYSVTEVIPGQPLPPALPAGTAPPAPDPDSANRDAAGL